MGYVLPFGQMSFWGATVITNLLSPFPSLVEWLCGGFCVHNSTLKRFFIFHFLIPFLLCGFLVLHIFNLHFLSSNNPLKNSTNNKIPFFPFIISKDLYFGLMIFCLYFLQINFGFSSLSHPDNALEACALLTPILVLLYFMRTVSLTYYFTIFSSQFCRFNGLYLWFWFLSFLLFVWIGGQFPEDNFLSYARILTLYYYFLLICILFA